MQQARIRVTLRARRDSDPLAGLGDEREVLTTVVAHSASSPRAALRRVCSLRVAHSASSMKTTP